MQNLEEVLKGSFGLESFREGQKEVIKEALQKSQINPETISYLEAHGTGTVLGDPIEVQALGAVLSKNRSEDHSLIIGSVKTSLAPRQRSP